MFKRQLHINVPLVMFDALQEIAERENKPRSYILREMLEEGIKNRQNKKAGQNGIK
tara:strand:+ start:1155 stop:1322 length:168 start_codon:yes stop_codon:yes gene_type:complete